ncbi:hypothetical protein [Bradyrhizobium sp. ORS 111]|uniref:hypothetical protein n=1 Tax=Bradyrhizobium sp. ORS 111 TaxID=1685958 RepID=UPI00388EBF9A
MGSGWLVDLVKESVRDWIANPFASVATALVFTLLGYFLSRLRYQGRIDALTERVQHRDDLIKMKDEAIAAASRANIASTTTIAAAPEPAATAPVMSAADRMATKATFPPDERFRATNDRIMRDTEAAIAAAIRSNRYRFVYNPLTNKSKVVRFGVNGEISEGRNGNEYRWRISGARLEIINDKNQVYSRFFLLPDKITLHHTNDPDLPSLKGQYFEPMRH